MLSSSSSLLLSSLELSDTEVYAPQIRALLGNASHLCAVAIPVLLLARPAAMHAPPPVSGLVLRDENGRMGLGALQLAPLPYQRETGFLLPIATHAPPPRLCLRRGAERGLHHHISKRALRCYYRGASLIRSCTPPLGSP